MTTVVVWTALTVCFCGGDQLFLEEGAAAPKDRSGVSELKPALDSPWHKALTQESGVEYHDVHDMASEFRSVYGVKIEIAFPGKDPKKGVLVSIHSARAPNRYWLKTLLNKKELTCELKGDTLHIKRCEPEEKGP